METKDLGSWEEFEATISTFLAKWQKLKQEKPSGHVSTPLFRGHADASWKLETTLERFRGRTFSGTEYHRIIRKVRPAVVSLTEKPWKIPIRFKPNIPIPGYAFMVYLRHHGFPSPLLDWTRSPFVAAFFAFRTQHTPQDGKVAIYAYVEWAGEGRLLGGGQPTIRGLGPYVVTHKRHYAQQCEYTICWKEINGNWEYASHEAAFTNTADDAIDQGTLTKYTVPVSERAKALERLHRVNITAFSLFGSEESLMETLAHTEI